jgi:thiamine-monophosphate kinase
MTVRRRFPAESEIISQIQQITQKKKTVQNRLQLSIGDDAAAFRIRPGYLLLVSSDALIERIHFDRKWTSPKDLGWKALAVNLSDIAAMGGDPLYALTTLGIPPKIPSGFIAAFYRGLNKLASRHGVSLVGGDTCSSPKDLFIDLTILGEVKPHQLLTRSGAKPGDVLFVTGTLGESAIGLELLKKGSKASHPGTHFIERHLRPSPRLVIGRYLSSHQIASALIDISDGLSTDLHHLCEQSRVGAVIEGSQIPLPKIPAAMNVKLAKSPMNYALNGGEDYELLFAVPSQKTHLVPSLIDGIPVHEIGKVTRQRGICSIKEGYRTRKLPTGGFDHFRKSRA